MMLPPNHDAAALNNHPLTPNTHQANLATEQSLNRGGVLEEIRGAQTSAAVGDASRSQERLKNTESFKANALLAYKTAEMQKSSGVGGEGKAEMFQYGQSVAPGVTDRNQMAAAIMQSLGLA